MTLEMQKPRLAPHALSPVLCANCRHVRASMIAPICAHPDVPPKDLATGEREWANFVRKFGPCGRHAKLFEPAPPPIAWHVRVLWRISKWLEARS